MSVTRRQFLHAGTALAASTAAVTAAPNAKETTSGKPLKFKLGTVTYNIAKDWDVPTLLKVCKASGLEAVELRTTHKHGVEPSLSKDDRRTIKQQFADSGVVIWGSGTTCEFHAADPAVVRQNIETCKAFIDLVADLGGKGVKVRPNALPPGVPEEKTLEQIGKSLIPCGKAAADAGVEIWVEVHGKDTAHPPRMKTMMEHCGLPNVGVTWNSNPTDLKNGSVAEYFALLKPWIKSCHINELYKDSTGVYPYRELFGLLREMDYDRYTLIELGKDMPTPASAEEFLRYYKALWLELAKGGCDLRK